MPLKFVVKSGPGGKFAFSVMSRNGRVIATSDEYSSRAAALNGVRSIQSQAAEAPIEDQSTKAWAEAEQSRSAETSTKAAKAAKPTKKAAKKRPPKAALPEPDPEEEDESSPAPVPRQAASFAEPILDDAGPQRVSLRGQPSAVPAGHTRRVVSMRRT